MIAGTLLCVPLYNGGRRRFLLYLLYYNLHNLSPCWIDNNLERQKASMVVAWIKGSLRTSVPERAAKLK